MVTWVIEREVFGDSDHALETAVRDHDGDVVAWRDDWWLDGRWPRLSGQRVVFHGSLANADRIRRELPWSPGAFCDTERFFCSAWWPTAAAALVAPTHLFTTVAELVHAGPPEEWGDRVFIRPDSPLKPFSGRVVARDAITFAALDHGYYYDDDDLPVVVTPLVEIRDEWRFVVARALWLRGAGTPQTIARQARR